MKIEQRQWDRANGWRPAQAAGLEADLVLVFGARRLLSDAGLLAELVAGYPGAVCVGCSTAGEICDTWVSDDTVVVTAISFEHSRVRLSYTLIEDAQDSADAGRRLVQGLEKDGLVHVLALSDGLQVNGSDLVQGITSTLPDGVTVTGGLSGDGGLFEETIVVVNGKPMSGAVVAVGLYGERLRIGYGSLGGWDSFGPERVITRSSGNVLYEMDGKSALQLYKTYLGDQADGLPATGLLYPLSLRTEEQSAGVVRTILAVDEQSQSLTFAGDVPEGAFVRLMKANFNRLVDGAVGAAVTSYQAIGSATPELAILISCVGRKMVLKQRIEEETEGVREVLGDSAVLTGFYSYGEISPFTPGAKCELHNQTMTITTLSER